jgi:hypothetical protein
MIEVLSPHFDDGVTAVSCSPENRIRPSIRSGGVTQEHLRKLHPGNVNGMAVPVVIAANRTPLVALQKGRFDGVSDSPGQDPYRRRRYVACRLREPAAHADEGESQTNKTRQELLRHRRTPVVRV